MDPNGKLFNAKLEKGNVGLGDEKIVIAEIPSRLPRYEEARRGNI